MASHKHLSHKLNNDRKFVASVWQWRANNDAKLRNYVRATFECQTQINRLRYTRHSICFMCFDLIPFRCEHTHTMGVGGSEWWRAFTFSTKWLTLLLAVIMTCNLASRWCGSSGRKMAAFVVDARALACDMSISLMNFYSFDVMHGQLYNRSVCHFYRAHRKSQWSLWKMIQWMEELMGAFERCERFLSSLVVNINMKFRLGKYRPLSN